MPREPAFARTGVSSPLGKLTEQIPAIRVSFETKEALEHEARAVGLTLQEFVRELLMIRAHGLDEMRKLHVSRLEVVSGMTKES